MDFHKTSISAPKGASSFSMKTNLPAFDKAKMSMTDHIATAAFCVGMVGLMLMPAIVKADEPLDPVRVCLDGMNAECKSQHNPIDDKDGFVACLDLMTPVCDTAYMSVPPNYQTPPHYGLADEMPVAPTCGDSCGK